MGQDKRQFNKAKENTVHAETKKTKRFIVYFQSADNIQLFPEKSGLSTSSNYSRRQM